jgi:amino acid transporter
MFLIFVVLVLVFTIVNLLVHKEPRTLQSVLNVFLKYYFLFFVGIAGLFAFIGHTFKADEVATKIGWPTGNPFQSEVAMANLAIGVLGLMAFSRDPSDGQRRLRTRFS